MRWRFRYGGLTVAHVDELSYDYIRPRFTPEARQLFGEMVEAHLAATGDRQFMFTASMGGSLVQLTSSDWMRADPDGGALSDLESYRLIRVSHIGRHGQKNYRIPGDSIHFYNWLMEQEGTPVEQIEADALRLVEGAEFAKRHPSAAGHVGEALSLLRSPQAITEQVASEIGGHLRGAVFDFAEKVTGGTGAEREKPIPTLIEAVENADVEDRERKVLVSLVDLLATVLSLDQRVTHVRDEVDKGVPLRGWDEVRRAVFTTVFACAELDRAL